MEEEIHEDLARGSIESARERTPEKIRMRSYILSSNKALIWFLHEKLRGFIRTYRISRILATDIYYLKLESILKGKIPVSLFVGFIKVKNSVNYCQQDNSTHGGYPPLKMWGSALLGFISL